MDLNQLAQQLQQNIQGDGTLTLTTQLLTDKRFAYLLKLLSLQTMVFTTTKSDIVVNGKVLTITGSKVQVYGQANPGVLTLTNTSGNILENELDTTLVNMSIAGLNQQGLLPLGSLPVSFFPSNTFPVINLSASSITFMLNLTVPTSTVDFTLLPSINLVLKGYGFAVSTLNDPATGNITTNFSVTGVFLIGKTELDVTVTVPINSNSPNNQWSLQFSTTQSLAGELNDILGLFPGINVLGSMPSEIVVLNKFSLSNMLILFDPTQLKIFSTSIQVSNPNPWEVVSGLTIESLAINMTLDFTGAKTNFTLDIDGSFLITMSNSKAELDVHVHMPFGGTEWVFSFEASLQIDNYNEYFNALPGLGGTTAPALPVQIQIEEFDVNSFVIRYNPVSKQLSEISFDISTEAQITLFNILEIVNPYIALDIANPFSSANRAISGRMGTQLNVASLPLMITAEKASPEDGWTFTGAMMPGSSINIMDLVKVFLKELGITSLPDWVNAIELDITDLSVSVYTPAPGAENQNNTYAVSGTVTWQMNYQSFALPELTATVDMTYDSSRTPSASAGSLTVDWVLLGMHFKLGYKFGTPDTEVYLEWEGIVCDYKHDSVKNQDIITVTFGSMSLGEIITHLIDSFSPGFTLPSPWSVLNSISLEGLSFKYTRNLNDSSQDVLVVTYARKISLGFMEIDTITLTKDQTGVFLGFTGSFLGIQITSGDPTTGPLAGKGSDVQNMPGVPGKGSDAFDLHFLGLGQHVTFAQPQSINSVKEAITALSDAFTDTNSSPNKIPLKKGGELVFAQDSGWLIGADFTVAKFYRLAAVFNDPNLYGLMIAIDKAAANFGNLEFEILYKKISDTIGMYQIDLQLPDVFRHLEFGEVSITLPNISIRIYTNGDFYFDFGFPASITDFSRSFTVQVFPFIGSGGFYFGWLSGATATDIPQTTNGIFNPVIEFGVGLSLGIGKTIDEGILKAGLSLMAVGIFQGTLAFFHPNPNLLHNGQPLKDDLYYRLQGTFGLTGHIYGEINFAIISARLDITAFIYVSIVIEAYKAIPITFSAGVTVSLRVTINLWLFKIHINLSFSATIKASFTIGHDHTEDASWNLSVGNTQRALQRAMLAAAQNPVTLKWQPVTVDTGTTYLLDIYFMPHLTISGEGTAPGPQYVSMLYIDTANAGVANQVKGLTALTTGILYWVVNALKGSSQTAVSLSWLNQQTISTDDLALLLCYFNTRPNSVAPFNYRNTSNNDIVHFLESFFTVQISAVDPTVTKEIQAAVFPVLPELSQQTDYNGTTGNQVNFATQSMTGDQGYLTAITALLKSLGVDYESAVSAQYFSSDDCANVSDPNYEQQDNLSMPTFIFTDFISIIAKQILQNSIDYMHAQGKETLTVLELVTGTVTDTNVQGLSGMSSRFLLNGLRLPAPPLAATGVVQPLYVLTGQQFAVPAALAKTDQYNIILTKPSADQWIVFPGGATQLSVNIATTEIQRINDLRGIVITPSLQTGSPGPVINYKDAPQAFTIGSPAIWQYPGSFFTGINTNPTIWKIPSNLAGVLAQNAGKVLPFNLLTITPNGDNIDRGTIQYSNWATTVKMTVQKITAGNLLNTALAGNMYNLVGADDAGTVLLKNLLVYINEENGGKDDFIQQIQLLYQPDRTTDTIGGYVSAANGALRMAVVQANLSTETNPTLAASFAMRGAAVRTPNTLNKPGDYIRLLWEDSIVRSGGFYFYYETLSDLKGLPDYLFNENGSAELTLVITYGNIITGSFINSVVIGDDIDVNKTTVYAQNDTITTRMATLQPGTVGYSVVRNNPGEYNPSGQPPSIADDQVYLQNQFNLLGAMLPGISAYSNLLPSGPADSMDENDVAQFKAGNVQTAATGAPWNYTSIIPYYKYVQASGYDPAYPDPYAGIGTTVQMQLNWQDMFGNMPGAKAADLSVPMPLLYTDQLIALSQWPSVSAFYLFTTVQNSPVINISFCFDTSKYSGGGADAQNKAHIDLQTYMQLYFQLNRTADIAMTYYTSLDGTAANPFGSSRPIDVPALVTNFISPIISYLKTVVNTGIAPGTTGIASPYTIASPIVPGTIADYENIFALTVGVHITRTRNIDPAFTSSSGVALAATALQPQSQKDACTIPSGDSSYLSLTTFAQQFETTFANQPTTGILLKIATGTNLSNNDSDPNAQPPIWVVRLDSTGANGIRYTYNNDEVYFFSPIPLANSLQSFSAAILPYASGKPYPAGVAVTNNFSSIDLDGWGLQFLENVDRFLSPAYAVPAFLLDNGVSLQKVLDAKQSLAEAIEGTIDFIIEPANKAGANIGNAQEKWKNQILIQLSNAYRFVAAVQTPVAIDSDYTGPNNDPPAAPYVPWLYGTMIGNDPSVPDESGSVPASTEYALSTAKVPMGNGSSWLTYMFEAKDTAASRSFAFGNMQYVVSHVEQQIQPVQGIDGYLASTWLTFVLPLDDALSNVGPITIPIPLRAYPTPPSILSQAGLYPVNDGATPPITIPQIRDWNYTYTYQNAAAAQDTINTKVEFNIPAVASGGMRAANGDTAPTLDQALAQFLTVYPLLSADLDANLLTLTAADVAGNTDKAQKAGYAVQALIAMADVVATAWATTNQVNPRKPQAMMGAMAFETPQVSSLSYTVVETGEKNTGDLVITISPVTGQQSTIIPSVDLNGYTRDPGGNSTVNRYKNSQGVYLSYDNRNLDPQRIMSLDGLDILQWQNSWAGVSVTRNQDLIQNEDGTWQTTNPLFIYQTPMVRFYDKLIPLLHSNQSVDIATINSNNFPNEQQRTIQENIEQLFIALTQSASMTSVPMKFSVDYQYTIAGTSLPVTLPVLLIPSGALTISDNGKQLADAIAGALTDWLKAHSPNTNNAEFSFNMTIYSVSDPNTPVLQVPLYLGKWTAIP
jgi:hypothetical protein